MDILQRMHASLNPGGYLMLGASEAMNNLGIIMRWCNAIQVLFIAPKP